MRCKGKLTQWDDDKGFGFVEPMGGGARAFVHIKAFTRKTKRPVDGDMLIYETEPDSRGRLQAVRVSFSGDKAPMVRQTPAIGSFSLWLICGFFALLCLWCLQQRLPLLLPLSVLLLSFLSYVAYALDKRAAQRGHWRTAESTLHLLAVLGGWPGALLAQQRLRHKSVKAEFRWLFWLTVIVHTALVNWLVWSWQGQSWLEALREWQNRWFF